MKVPERDTLPDFRGPMDPIGIQKSDSPRERVVNCRGSGIRIRAE